MKRCWITFLSSWTHNWWSRLDRQWLFYGSESFPQLWWWCSFLFFLLVSLSHQRPHTHSWLCHQLWHVWTKNKRSLIRDREREKRFKRGLSVSSHVGCVFKMSREKELLLVWRQGVCLLICVFCELSYPSILIVLIITGSLHCTAYQYRKKNDLFSVFFKSCIC